MAHKHSVVYGWTATHALCGELHLDVYDDRTGLIYAATLAAGSLNKELTADERLDVMVGPLTESRLTISRSYLQEFCLDVERVPDFVYAFVIKLKMSHDADTTISAQEDEAISHYIVKEWSKSYYHIT